MKATTKRPRTSDVVEILDRRMKNKPRLRRLAENAEIEAKIAQLAFDARNAAGLTQQELAKRVGTTKSVIARIEDSDYGDGSLLLLFRIASALNHRVDLFLLPQSKRKAA